MSKLFALIRGLNVPPAIVGLARGAVEAAVMAGLVEVLVLFQATDWADAWWAVVVVYGIRQAESVADAIDPEKKRAP
jgi:hypothetical protein